MKYLKYINEKEMSNKFSMYQGGNQILMGVAKANNSIDHIINKLGLTRFKTPTEDTVITPEGMKAILNDIGYIQGILNMVKAEISKNK